MAQLAISPERTYQLNESAETKLWSWQVGGFSEFSALDIYNKGFEDGKKATSKELVETHDKAVAKVLNIHTQVYSWLVLNGYSPKKSWMKPLGLTSFKILTVVPPEKYYSGLIEAAYQKTDELIADLRDTEFEIWFSFIAESEDLDTEAITKDGFRYELTTGTAKTEARR